MSKPISSRLAEMIARQPAMTASHERSNRAARLEHARMGRSVCQGGPNKTVIWLTPKEVFASYGLDEHGNPPPDAAAS